MFTKESQIRDAIANEYNGRTEVVITGTKDRIDVLTDQYIIECKLTLDAHSIKGAIGQVNYYASFHPGKVRVIAGLRGSTPITETLYDYAIRNGVTVWFVDDMPEIMRYAQPTVNAAYAQTYDNARYTTQSYDAPAYAQPTAKQAYRANTANDWAEYEITTDFRENSAIATVKKYLSRGLAGFGAVTLGLFVIGMARSGAEIRANSATVAPYQYKYVGADNTLNAQDLEIIRLQNELIEKQQYQANQREIERLQNELDKLD